MAYQIEDTMKQVTDMMKDERKVIVMDGIHYQVSRRRIEMNDEIFGFYLNSNSTFKLVTAHSIIGRALKVAIFNGIPSPIITE